MNIVDSFVIVETFQVLLAAREMKKYIYKKRVEELKHQAMVMTLKPSFWRRKREFSKEEYKKNIRYLWQQTEGEYWHIGMQFWLDIINRLITAAEMSSMQYMLLSSRDAESLKKYWL